jgi:DNA-binding transcriptional ArsR family regulator
LFGNADRLEVALAVARSSSGVVHAQELSDRLGISPPRVRTQLLSFVDAGVMEVLPRHGNIVNYQRLPDPFWSGVENIANGWGAEL